MAKQQNRRPSRSSKAPWIVAAIVLGTLCLALLGLVVSQIISDSDDDVTAQPDGNVGPAGQTPAALADGSLGEATLRLELEDYRFKISGFVADDETSQQLQRATELVYGELGQFDLVVDPSREGLAPSESLVPLPVNLNRLIDGSFSITGNAMRIDGVAPDTTTQQALVDLAQELGFSVDDQTSVATLRAPDIKFVRTGSQVDIIGDVNNDKVGTIITQVIARDFGAENVNTDQLFVDPAVYTRFNLITTAGALKLYGAFGDFDIGFEENRLGGVMPRGIGFATGSAEIGPQQKAKLEVFPPLLINLTDLKLTVVGHTDDVGPEADNQVLSEARAEAIIGLFKASGIDESRLTAVGKGSTEPVESNDTAAGRTSNRRVTFQLN